MRLIPSVLALLACASPALQARAEGLDELRSEYDSNRNRLELERRYLADELRLRRRPKERAELYAHAERILLAAIDRDLVPAWVGTPWTFSGTSDVPGEGSIACGFLVGTILDHAGFRLDRIALGRLASEHIALSLTGERNLRRYSDEKASRVAAELLDWGPGLYAVGLDYHAALARVTDDGELWFIHSTVAGTGGVIKEPLLGENPFKYSRYRVIAKLLDDQMLKRWIEGSTFEVYGS